MGSLLDRVEARLEKYLGHMSKAKLESALGEAGTVGAMKLDNFVAKLKTAIHEYLGSQSLPSAGRVSQLPTDLLPADNVVGREGSSSVSLVPTLFADPGSVSVSGDATSVPATAAKLCNGLQDHK